MTLLTEIEKLIVRVRKKSPLVHNITNYVTVNDCANAILAVGGSPVMADDINETADITAVSSALVINIGTLNERTVKSMLLSGKTANKKGIPVVLDPVGAGASQYRTDTLKSLLSEVKFSVIKGNMSEICCIAGLEATAKGVDSGESELEPEFAAKTAAKRFGCTVALTGKTDIITDSSKTVFIDNGNSLMKNITGTGCMSAAIIGAFLGTGTDAITAAAAGMLFMGIAGDTAYGLCGGGTGSMRTAIIDTLSKLDGHTITDKAKLYEKAD